MGMSSLEAWENSRTVDVSIHNALFLIFGVIFFFAPAILFVIGPKYLRAGFPWPRSLFTSEYWAEFGFVVFRMFFWFVGAAAGAAAFWLIARIAGM